MTEPKQVLRLRFRAKDRVGAADAEHDSLLQAAFFDTGQLDILREPQDPRCIVVGRTGSGKTALLLRLKEIEGPERCIDVSPEALSMQYLSNSTIIPHLTDAGVHLEVFYKLLWRHVFLVEIIRRRFGITDEFQVGRFRSWLAQALDRDKRKRKAIEYVEEFGTRFWEDAELIVRHVVTKLEEDVKAKVGSTISGLSGGVEAGTHGSQERREEFRVRAQEVVNQLQLQRLNDAIKVLREDILESDEQRRFYLLVDDLDRNWVDGQYAYDLIDALLAEAGEFARIPGCKVVVALRENILQKLYQRTRNRGVQREKHETLCLRLRWEPAKLIDMLDLRLGELFKDVAGIPVSLSTILPRSAKRAHRGDPKHFLLERTFLRPRDLIHFVNECVQLATDKDRVSWADILKAEAKYSADRLRSLEDEWGENYPELQTLLESLRGIHVPFNAGEFDDERLLRVLTHGEHSTPEHSEAAFMYQLWTVNEHSEGKLKEHLFRVLFEVGALGVKGSPQEGVKYSYEDPYLAESGLFTAGALYVHPALWRALGIHARR